MVVVDRVLMKRIILILLLLMMSLPGRANKEVVYCYTGSVPTNQANQAKQLGSRA